jgi:glycerol-3-phosphate acyltransferase PlsX
VSGATASTIRVAVDLLGGDGGPEVIVDGALRAARGHGIDVVLVGPPDVATELLRTRGATGALDLEPASECVQMGEDPVRAVRAKRDATVRVAARLVREGRADAAVSTGSTGAFVVASVFTLGRLPGVSRPAIAVTVPATQGPVVLLDAGANVECTAELLVQFALCGAAYAAARFHVDRPRIGLLCNGTEPAKGDELRRTASALLGELPLPFVGYVESGAVTSGGVADVVVTDGFTGNVLLKGIEGMHALAREQIGRALRDPDAALAALDPLGADRLGGALLLGVPGTIVIGHGASGADAVAACIRLAAEAVRERLVPRVTEAMAAFVPRSSTESGATGATAQQEDRHNVPGQGGTSEPHGQGVGRPA